MKIGFGLRKELVGWEESGLSRYDIRAEGALPPGKNVITRVNV